MKIFKFTSTLRAIGLSMAIVVGFNQQLLAHVSVTDTAPADNAMLMASPENISLTFSKASRIVKLTVRNRQGNKLETDFKPTKQAIVNFTLPLPTLTPDTYTVDVTFFGEDGHKMKHSFSFMVH
ncbi:copper resistance protein CopC [Alteromonas sp. ASW11-36]|uniref:Copper resistance protein CopC n=1 Tax=Alteromonas arenosi TaxID=3055817 RepID=A0ABT7SWK0_9ALTE|nr:copper resistance protein CopC [Alteromonas sp. ASW11-36]MDM7859937.1 copper resistance protein CopC [Alteromonas sp. ASW11-36]